MQHGLFVGALFDDGSDMWDVNIEHVSLAKAMRPLKSLLTFNFVRADSADEVDGALAIFSATPATPKWRTGAVRWFSLRAQN